MCGYVYILKTATGQQYIGSTKNVANRLREHERGKVISTKHKRPVALFAIRTFNDIKEAAVWEKKYKRSHGQLERDIRKGLFADVAVW